ncbi:MAG: peroxiredoxin-like family protein [Pseudomonadota bacterium]
MSRPIPRQAAPELDIATLDGRWQLSERKPKAFSMIVFYRGLHCPICKGQLRDLNRKAAEFANRGVEFIAVSGDSRERAEQSSSDWGIDGVPLGYGLDESSAREWGLYVSTAIRESEPPTFYEPGLFLVRPDGVLYAASTQSMPFSRPSFEDILNAVDFIADNDYPARGEA